MTSRAVVYIRSQFDRDKVSKWAQNVDFGTKVEFRKKSRSTLQNALLWARLSDVSKQVEWYGQYLSSEDWKDIFSASLRRARVVPGIDNGSFVPLGMRTSDMTIDEMTNLLDLIDAFAAERGVVWSDEPASSPGAVDGRGSSTSAQSDPGNRLAGVTYSNVRS